MDKNKLPIKLAKKKETKYLYFFYSGKIARSKPIVQRLSSNKVKSYKYIYILNGNIVDERNGK